MRDTRSHSVAVVLKDFPRFFFVRLVSGHDGTEWLVRPYGVELYIGHGFTRMDAVANALEGALCRSM